MTSGSPSLGSESEPHSRASDLAIGVADPTLTPRAIDPTADPQRIFELLAEEAGAGRSVVLVVVTGVTGPSSRNVGTLMAVRADGGYAGSLSSGCVESAIAIEALDALRAGEPRALRLGLDSPYVDIQLPCGGGLDVLLVPNPALDEMEALALGLRQRRPVTLQVSQGAVSVFHYTPRLRVVVAGQGAEAVAMLRSVRAYGGEALLITPQAALLEHAMAEGIPARLLRRSVGEDLSIDSWTAVVLLFHDHHLEIELLPALIQSPAFWIGAMGGQKTRANRCEALRQAGCLGADIERIHSPIGLIPSARDPSTLALSAMADIVLAFRKAGAAATAEVCHSREAASSVAA